MTNPGITNMISYYRMDERSGDRVDSRRLYSDDFYDLDAQNSPGYGVGRRGKAVDLIAAKNQSLSKDDSPSVSIGNRNYAIGLWFKARNIGSNIRLLGKWNESGTKEYQISVYSSKVYFYVRDGTGTTSFYVRADNFGTLENDVWYFIYAHYNKDADDIVVGVNDVYNTDTGPVNGVYDGTNTLYYGRDESGIYYLDGLIDEVFIYLNDRLTTAERTWMYNEGYGRTYSEVAEISTPPIDIVSVPTPGTVSVAVLDSSLKVIGLVEDYYSLSWAERYSEVGDFELELPIEYAENSIIDFGNFLYIKTSDELMVIEDIKPSISEEESSLIVQGQSAESLLMRRVLLNPINVSGRAEISAYSFIENHITDPDDSDRAIAIFETIFPEMLTTVLYEEQLEMQTVYEAIERICKNTGLGFRVVMYNDELVFYIYEGEDRSYDQSVNPYVIFSDDFDNVIESSFYESEKDKINIVLVATNDQTPSLQRVFVWEGTEPTGSDRHETVFETEIERVIGEEPSSGSTTEITTPTLGISGKVCLDAVGITTTPVIEISTYIPPLTDSEVLSIINTRGKEVIKENKIVGLFEGDFDIQGNFKYGTDFFMGDIVQCNITERNVKARIVELVRSYSTEGEKSYVAMDFII